MQREISLLLAKCENFIDITHFRLGLHNTPKIAKPDLRKEINILDEGTNRYTCPDPFDAILLIYGLCNNAITGLKSNGHKLIIPEAYDCITFLMGSREAYNHQIFNSTGWVENVKMSNKARLEEIRLEFIEIYTEENAQFLTELESNLIKDNHTAFFLYLNRINSYKAKLFNGDCSNH